MNSNKQKTYTEKEDMRFIFLCRNFVDTNIFTYKEIGILFGEQLENGLVKPVSPQGVYDRRKRIEARIGQN